MHKMHNWRCQHPTEITSLLARGLFRKGHRQAMCELQDAMNHLGRAANLPSSLRDAGPRARPDAEATRTRVTAIGCKRTDLHPNISTLPLIRSPGGQCMFLFSYQRISCSESCRFHLKKRSDKASTISSHLVLSRVHEATQDKVTSHNCRSHIGFSRSCELARSLRKSQRTSKSFVVCGGNQWGSLSHVRASLESIHRWKPGGGKFCGECTMLSALSMASSAWFRSLFSTCIELEHFCIIASLFTGLPMPGLYPCEL
jgi:hypothetical protein